MSINMGTVLSNAQELRDRNKVGRETFDNQAKADVYRNAREKGITNQQTVQSGLAAAELNANIERKDNNENRLKNARELVKKLSKKDRYNIAAGSGNAEAVNYLQGKEKVATEEDVKRAKTFDPKSTVKIGDMIEDIDSIDISALNMIDVKEAVKSSLDITDDGRAFMENLEKVMMNVGKDQSALELKIEASTHKEYQRRMEMNKRKEAILDAGTKKELEMRKKQIALNKKIGKAGENLGKSYDDMFDSLDDELKGIIREIESINLAQKFKEMDNSLKKAFGGLESSPIGDMIQEYLALELEANQSQEESDLGLKQEEEDIQTHFEDGITKLDEVFDAYIESFRQFQQEQRIINEEIINYKDTQSKKLQNIANEEANLTGENRYKGEGEVFDRALAFQFGDQNKTRAKLKGDVTGESLTSDVRAQADKGFEEKRKKDAQTTNTNLEVGNHLSDITNIKLDAMVKNTEGMDAGNIVVNTSMDTGQDESLSAYLNAILDGLQAIAQLLYDGAGGGGNGSGGLTPEQIYEDEIITQAKATANHYSHVEDIRNDSALAYNKSKEEGDPNYLMAQQVAMSNQFLDKERTEVMRQIKELDSMGIEHSLKAPEVPDQNINQHQKVWANEYGYGIVGEIPEEEGRLDQRDAERQRDSFIEQITNQFGKTAASQSEDKLREYSGYHAPADEQTERERRSALRQEFENLILSKGGEIAGKSESELKEFGLDHRISYAHPVEGGIVGQTIREETPSNAPLAESLDYVVTKSGLKEAADSLKLNDTSVDVVSEMGETFTVPKEKDVEGQNIVEPGSPEAINIQNLNVDGVKFDASNLANPHANKEARNKEKLEEVRDKSLEKVEATRKSEATNQEGYDIDQQNLLTNAQREAKKTKDKQLEDLKKQQEAFVKSPLVAKTEEYSSKTGNMLKSAEAQRKKQEEKIAAAEKSIEALQGELNSGDLSATQAASKGTLMNNAKFAQEGDKEVLAAMQGHENQVRKKHEQIEAVARVMASYEMSQGKKYNSESRLLDAQLSRPNAEGMYAEKQKLRQFEVNQEKNRGKRIKALTDEIEQLSNGEIKREEAHRLANEEIAKLESIELTNFKEQMNTLLNTTKEVGKGIFNDLLKVDLFSGDSIGEQLIGIAKGALQKLQDWAADYVTDSIYDLLFAKDRSKTTEEGKEDDNKDIGKVVATNEIEMAQTKADSGKESAEILAEGEMVATDTIIDAKTRSAEKIAAFGASGALLATGLATGNSKATGAGIGGLAGGIIGSFFGQTALGSSLGGAIGGLFYDGSDSVAAQYSDMSIADAMRVEQQKSGKNPVLAVLHEQEAVLSTLNGDADTFRRLKKSGDWDVLKNSYAYGIDSVGSVGNSFVNPVTNSSKYDNSKTMTSSVNNVFNISATSPDVVEYTSRAIMDKKNRLGL